MLFSVSRFALSAARPAGELSKELNGESRNSCPATWAAAHDPLHCANAGAAVPIVASIAATGTVQSRRRRSFRRLPRGGGQARWRFACMPSHEPARR
jgi:hypothetical protein